MAEPLPVILDNASLVISGVELACLLSHIELTPDVATNEIKTMCGAIDYPGTVKWSLKATLYQSFDVDGTEEVLSAAVEGGIPVPFEVKAYRSKPTSATNPIWTGDVVPQPYPPIIGDAGAPSEIDIEWSVVGAPVKSDTDPLPLTAGAPEGVPLPSQVPVGPDGNPVIPPTESEPGA